MKDDGGAARLMVGALERGVPIIAVGGGAMTSFRFEDLFELAN